MDKFVPTRRAGTHAGLLPLPSLNMSPAGDLSVRLMSLILEPHSRRWSESQRHSRRRPDMSWKSKYFILPQELCTPAWDSVKEETRWLPGLLRAG